MSLKKTKLALAVAAATSLAACGGGSSGNGGGGGGGGDAFTLSDVNGVTLNIPAGTMIYGAANTEAGGALVISRGSDINVNGTEEQPVVMSGVDVDLTANDVITGDPESLGGRGDFGGLVIDGFARTNAGDASGQAESEVVPQGQTRTYGGNDDADDSGSIQYLVIAESGFAFRPDEEVQGLTLEAVGSGTDISYVQVIGSDDDGIEWFGGTVDVDHVVINGATDDSLDQDLGWRGNGQFALVRQGSGYGNRGMETDNNGDNFGATPATSPNWANVTILGNAGNSTRTQGETTTGALHREGWRGKVYRSVYSDDTLAGGQFTEGCLDLDEYGSVPSEIQYRDVLFSCASASLPDDSGDDQNVPSGTSPATWQQAAVDAGNVEFDDATSFDINSDTFAIENVGMTPQVSLPSGFESADYYGAVDPATAAGQAWWNNWTAHVAQTGTDPNGAPIPAGSDGSLLDQDIHPLEDNIGSDIVGAGSNACTSVNSNFEDGGEVRIFGESFPVCVIPADALENLEDGTTVDLVNDHVWVLDGLVTVGNGGNRIEDL